MTYFISPFKCLLFALVLVLVAGSWSASAADEAFRIAFGSCNRSDRPQPLWSAVLECKPDVWIWGGDNIYGDSLDMQVLQTKYAAQKANEDYRRLASVTKVIGIWDDHDYGKNDAGQEFPAKVSSQAQLLDFLDEPTDSPRRRQAGVYTSYLFGAGSEQVKVILLDARYHREEPGPDSDILGPAQWEWLETKLRQSKARVNLIVSGIQVLPTEQRYEKWGQFPAARERLLALVRESGAKQVIFLSGDRHQAEISKLSLAGMPALYDITSSGLTHVAKGNENEPNRLRIAGPVAELNFGLLTFDWGAAEPSLQVEIRGVGNAVLLETEIPLAK